MNPKRMFVGPLAIGVFVIALGLKAKEETANRDVTEQLIAVDKAMQRSFITRDAATLASILSDDYLLVTSSGKEYTKSEVLKELQSPNSHWDTNETSGWNVRVHGDVAIVVATLHQKGTDHGKAFDNNVKFSDTYVRANGQWRIFHAHASRAVDITHDAG